MNAAAAQPYAVPWPASGTSALAVDGLGVVAGRDLDRPVSTASIAKVILALCVLQKRPLVAGAQGPSYTISARDMDFYFAAQAENGSVLRVERGERLTEHQALSALMLPSADNIAESLVRWEFGSHDAYRQYAMAFLRSHGLTHTVIGGDASGLDPSTTSTARDLVRLGLVAIEHPVLAEIVRQPHGVFPVAGWRPNYNSVLGVAGIDGLKTGNNRLDRGAFLFTATVTVGGRPVRIAGAVLNQDSLAQALEVAPRVVEAAQRGLSWVPVVRTAQAVGTYDTAWAAAVTVRAAAGAVVLRWRGQPVTQALSPDASTLSVTSGAYTETLPAVVDPPRMPWWWRLVRP